MALPSKPSRPTLPSRPVRRQDEDAVATEPQGRARPNRLPTRSQLPTAPSLPTEDEEEYEDTFSSFDGGNDDFSFGVGGDDDNNTPAPQLYDDEDEDSYEYPTQSSRAQYEEAEEEEEKEEEYKEPSFLNEFEPSDDETFGVPDPNEEIFGGGEFSDDFAMDFAEYEITSDDGEPDHVSIINNAITALPESSKDAAENFFELLDNDEISEITMKSPTKIIYKKKGRRLSAQNVAFASTEEYHNFINTVVLGLTDTSEKIDGTNHLIEGRLTFPSPEPNVADLTARVHIITPPVVKNAVVTLAKKSRIQYTLDDMVDFGTLTPSMAKFLKAIARGKATTVFSGVSGSGKTTLIESMAYYFDPDDSVVVVEDTPELRIQYGNVTSLTANTPKPGMDERDVVSMEWLVKATNRMRPDRIIVGECRGGEFSEFLIAANSGADGSMTTIHAANPRLTLQKMLSLALKNGTSKSEEAVVRDISSTVHIIVQADLIDGKHIISRIEEVSNNITSKGNLIGTQTIFEYDRLQQRHITRNQPSDDLKEFLGQRGVETENDWFRI